MGEAEGVSDAGVLVMSYVVLIDGQMHVMKVAIVHDTSISTLLQSYPSSADFLGIC
jgi:hypothetical protein